MAHPATSPSTENKKRLMIVLALTGTYLIAEVVGGILTGSLALLADAGHMLTDVSGLAIALFAIHIAELPANEKRTFGYYRAEILSSVMNAVILIGLSLYILFEAYQRFQSPPEVKSTGMFIVAGVGLVINLIGMKLLKSASEKSLNMKGAYFEVLSDLLTSIGVMVGAVIIAITGWNWVDPVVSAGIGLFIFPRTWILLKEAVGVLLEGTPANLNLQSLRETLCKIPGVESIHDLHAWSVTSGMNAVSAHVVLSDSQQSFEILKIARESILSNFEVSHVTLQLEPRGFAELEVHI